MDPKCVVCEKTVYATEKIMVNSKAYHKPCFRCAHCKSVLNQFDRQRDFARLLLTKVLSMYSETIKRIIN
ncbi:unnamed protein product [Rotaria magnacalcarata]